MPPKRDDVGLDRHSGVEHSRNKHQAQGGVPHGCGFSEKRAGSVLFRGRVAFTNSVCALLVAWSVIVVNADERKVPVELWQKVQIKGTVLVIVSLNVPVQLIGKLSKEEVVAQQERISAAQDAPIAELMGTKYQVIRRFTLVAGIALSVGSEALAALERSALVKKVTENIAIPAVPLELREAPRPVEKKQSSE